MNASRLNLRAKIERLEDRRLLAVVSLGATPSSYSSGDGNVDVSTDDGLQFGTNYSVSANAGYGPGNVSGRWERSSGTFNIAGPLVFRIEPEQGESDGMPAIATLSFDLRAEGGTGAGVFGGTTDFIYGATYQSDGQSGVLAAPEAKSPVTFDASPTSNLSETLVNIYNRSVEIVTEIGKTIVVDLDLRGVSVSWQGGFTGASRGFVYANASVGLSVRTVQPNFSVVQFGPHFSDAALSLGYRVEGIFDEPVSGGLYWSGDDTYDPSDQKAVDVAISNTRGTHTTTIDLASLPDPPPNADYIVFVIDPYVDNQGIGEVAETFETDNDRGVPIYNDPTVIFATTSSPQKNIEYGIYAIVESRSLVRDEYTISVQATPSQNSFTLDDGTPLDFQHDVLRGDAASGSLTFELSGLERRRIDLQTVRDSWNWLPTKNPVTGVNGLKQALGEIADVGIEELLSAFSEIASGVFSLYDIVSDFTEALETNVPYQIYHDLTYEARVETSFPSTFARDVVPVRVGVPALRQAYRDDFLAGYRAGGYALGQGAALAVAGAGGLIFAGSGLPVLLTGVGMMSYGITRLFQASDAYEKAVDPPDFNYQEIPVPESWAITTPSELAATPVMRVLFEAPLEAAALTMAATTARNRADGALLDAEPEWQATQLAAAAALNTSAAATYANYVGAITATGDFYQRVTGETPAEAFTLVKDSGLPAEVTTLLQESGFTQEQIDAFAEGLAELSPDAISASPEFDLTAVVAAASLSATAIDEIREAVTIQRDQLGLEVEVVSDETLTTLQSTRETLVDRIESGNLKGTLLQDIVDHVESLNQLVVNTNALEQLESELIESHNLLFRFAHQAPSIQRLQAKIDQFKDDSAVSSALADSLRARLNTTSEQLADGDFKAAAASLLEMVEQITSHLGDPSSVSAQAADAIVSQAIYLYQYLENGTLESDFEGIRDVFYVMPGSEMSLDPIANDRHAPGMTLQLDGVLDVVGGTTMIDDGGTPDDPTDDRVKFAASEEFQGGSFTYAVSSTNSPLVDFAAATVLPGLPFDEPFDVSVAPDDEYRLSFHGTAGDVVFLRDIDPDFDYPVRTIVDPHGQSESVSRNLIAVNQNGPHTILWNHDGWAEGEQDTTVLAAQLSQADPIGLDGPFSLTVPASDPNGFEGVAFLRIPIDEPGRQTVSLSGQTFNTSFEMIWRNETGDMMTEWFSDNGVAAIDFPTAGSAYLLVYNDDTSEAQIEVSRSIPATVSRSVAFGEVVNEQFAEAGERREYRFEAMAGDRVLLDALGPYETESQWSLRDPDGQLVDFFWPRSLGQDSQPFTLLLDGEYTIEVDASDRSLAAIQFRLLDLDDIPTLEFNTSTTVTINEGAASTGFETAIFRLPANRDVEAVFVSEALLGTTAPSLATWTVQNADPSGPWPGANDGPIDGSYSASLLDGSDYHVIISATGTEPVEFRFRVEDGPRIRETDLELGAIAAGQLQAPRETHRFDVEFQAGQILLFESGETTGARKLVTVTAPNGRITMFTTADRSLPFVASEAGRHQISVSGNEDSTVGHYAFRVVDLTQTATPAALDESTLLSLGAHEVRVLTVEGLANQIFAATHVAGPTDGVRWSSFNGRGQRDAFARAITSGMVLTTDSSGRSLIIVENRSATTVDVEIEVSAVAINPQPLIFDSAVYGQLEGFGATSEYQFNVDSQTALMFDSLDSDADGLFAEVLDANRQTIFAFSTDEDSEPLALPAAGSYTLRVRGYEGREGDFGFRVLDLASAPTVILGEPVVGNLIASEVGDNPTRILAAMQIQIEPGNSYRLSAQPELAPFSQPAFYSTSGEPANWDYDLATDQWFYLHPAGALPSQLLLVIRGSLADTASPTDDPFAFVITETPLDPPVATDDVINIRQGQETLIDVLENDQWSTPLEGLEIVTLPENGLVQEAATGLLQYAPAPGYSGIDTFAYRLIDTAGQVSQVATVTVTVTPNQPPTAFDDAYVTDMNSIVEMDLLQNDSDPDGELDSNSLTIIEAPQHGVVSMVPSETLSDDDGSPVGDGYASALAGTIGRETQLVVSGYPDYDFQGAHFEQGSYRLFVRFNISDFSNFQSTVFDQQFDGLLEIGQLDVFDLSGYAVPGTPFIAWIDNTTGGSFPDTVLQNVTVGGILYTPDLDYQGVDTFSYQVADDSGAFSPAAHVHITVGSSRVPGDSNGDGQFDSSDLVQVFQRGKYENGSDGSATWEDGDWNGDGQFNTSDLVFAFAAGTYSRSAEPSGNLRQLVAALDSIWATWED